MVQKVWAVPLDDRNIMVIGYTESSKIQSSSIIDLNLNHVVFYILLLYSIHLRDVKCSFFGLLSNFGTSIEMFSNLFLLMHRLVSSDPLQPVIEVSDISRLESTHPRMSFTCRFRRAFYTVIYRILLIIAGTFLSLHMTAFRLIL